MPLPTATETAERELPLFQCDRCERDCEQRSRVFVDGETQHWCATCARVHAFYCHECDERFSRDDAASHSYRGYHLCERCFNDEYFICDSCDNVRRSNDEYAGNGLCNLCHAAENDGPILEYDADPPRGFHGDGPHYFGVE